MRVGGDAVLDAQTGSARSTSTCNRAELLSLPITLIVLVVVFGGLIAAGLPVLAAVVSVASRWRVLLVLHEVHRRRLERA